MINYCIWNKVGFMFYPECCQKEQKDVQMGQIDTEVFKFCPFCGKHIRPLNSDGVEIKYISRSKK
jgi:hypothetical protein